MKITASSMGKRSWEARKKKYGPNVMKSVRNGESLKVEKKEENTTQ